LILPEGAATLAPVLDLKTRPRANAETPPVQGWRNYYRFYRVLHLMALGTVFPGVHAGPSLFDSKEIAENHAMTFLGDFNMAGRIIVEHVGAYSEGGKAN
jgi:hypothetical protein